MPPTAIGYVPTLNTAYMPTVIGYFCNVVAAKTIRVQNVRAM